MRIVNGIHKVDGFRVGNAYVVETSEGLLVIDSGMPGSAKHVLRTIQALGGQPADVRLLVLTHWHPDHMGGAAELQRVTGTTVGVHELDASIVAGGELPKKGRRGMRLVIRALRLRPLTADLHLRAGDEVMGFRVLHVPGHTAGSIAFERDGIVFTGDALLGDRHGRLQPPDLRLSLDPASATRSAERIRDLAPRLVLPGHGVPARS